jgi:hypothetical protein
MKDYPTLAITWPQGVISEGDGLTEAAQVYGDVRQFLKHLLDSGTSVGEPQRNKKIP